MKAFWSCGVREVSASEVKHLHKMDRTIDSKMRLTVKQNIRDEGVTSNLYPITAAPDAVVYRYELTVTRKSTAAGHQSAMTTTTAGARGGDGGRRGGSTTAPISAAKGWRSFATGLKRFASLPPMVRVDNRVYSATPLQHDMLELPKEYHDIGWESCRLQPVDKLHYMDLPPAEYRTLVNKLFPWSIGLHAQRDGSFTTAREVDGKIVCTHDGVSVSGLRIYRGTTANALFIDADGGGGPDGGATPSRPKRLPPPRDAVLKTLGDGPIDQVLTVRCVRHDREVNFKNFIIQAFTVEDSSGSMTLSAWGASVSLMLPGKVYTLHNVRIRTNAKGKVLEYTHGKGIVAEAKEENPPDASDPTTTAPPTATTPLSPAAMPKAVASPPLALKLDTKCLVASERSLWDEVRQHFGAGPYDEDTQRRVARVVQGTPIVVSTNLRHAAVRMVKFNVNPETVVLEPALKSVLGELDRGQPYALLQDHSVVPLQALHCCFDPRMRTWQDVTVATCSFVPQKRVDVLSGFRTALEHGLSLWGLRLAVEPFVSRSLAILEAPSKEFKRPGGAQYIPGAQRIVNMPTSIMFCSIANERTSGEERDKNISTAQHLAKEFRSAYHAHCTSEVEAAAAIEAALMEHGRLRDANAAAVIVTSDRDTRATRWLVGEMLRRGILPVCIPGVSSGRRQGLLTANVRVNLRTKFEQDPLKGIDLGKEVPSVAGKHVLIVGIDCCSTASATIGSVVGVLTGPWGNKVYSTFWRNTVRGQEVEQVAEQFGFVIQKAMQHHRLDEIIVFQDGNVFSELHTMKKRIPVGCGLTFMCLHKRTNIRFLFKGKSSVANATKGCVIQSHTPSPLQYKPLAPAFYMQSHECPMSTARAVEYTVHAISETLDVEDVQKISYATSHVFAPLATKLPLPTRCAHRLGSIAERIIDASPEFQAREIPDTLSNRMWFL